MQQIAIVGLGNFGYYLGRDLYARGFDVIGLDIDKAMVQRVKNDISQAVVADATDRETLSALGVGEAQAAVVTIGTNMLASIIATFHLKELGVAHVYAKALSEEHARILDRMGADEVLFPEKDLALSLSRRIHNPNMLEYLPFIGDHGIFDVDPPASIQGKSLRELDLTNRYGVQVVAVRDRGRQTVNFIPKADYLVGSNDELIILGSNENMDKLTKDLKVETESD